MKFPKGTRTEKNKEFMKIYTLYKSMMQRCYLETCGSYKNYGAKGITVSSEWRNLDNFISTIDSVEGFNMEKLLYGELQLDKDTKYKGNTTYSKETCRFITPKENYGNRSNNYNIIGVSPTYSIYEFNNVDKFSREHNLIPRNIWNVLNVEGYYTHRKWQFFYMENFSKDKIKYRKEYLGISPDGNRYIFSNIKRFSEEHNLLPNLVGKVLNNKQSHHKKWKFYFNSYNTENLQRLSKE